MWPRSVEGSVMAMQCIAQAAHLSSFPSYTKHDHDITQFLDNVHAAS